MLDSALWRRFEAIVPFPLPKEQDRVLVLRVFFRDRGHLALPEWGGRTERRRHQPPSR